MYNKGVVVIFRPPPPLLYIYLTSKMYRTINVVPPLGTFLVRGDQRAGIGLELMLHMPR